MGVEHRWEGRRVSGNAGNQATGAWAPAHGTPFDAVRSAPLLDPPQFMLIHYVTRLHLATIVSHTAYGAIVGGFSSLAG
jgi:hypothetical protein